MKLIQLKKISFKKERNMKIHIIMAILVVILGMFFKISKIEWIICIFAIAIVIASELFNTAIETIVDMITTEKKKNEARVPSFRSGGSRDQSGKEARR